MNVFLRKIHQIWHDTSLRNKLLITLGALVVFRFLATIPIPGIDLSRLQAFLADSQFFGLLNIFSGGGLSNLSIVMLGVGPYITAAIIMQVLTVVFPRLKAMYQEEGEIGRRKFAQYTRLFSLPLAVIQAFSFLILLQNQGAIDTFSSMEMVINIIIITAGSILLMWIGELITEYGVGNGVSLLIFAGIVASVPSVISRIFLTYDPSQVPTYLAFLAVGLIVTLGVVVITEAERPIPITYAKQVRGRTSRGGASTYLPLRLNQAGVIPIIFALSLLLFPQMIAGFLTGLDSSIAQTVSEYLTAFINNVWLYGIFYFVLVFAFTYFYTAVTFDPKQIAENLQKSGAFVPGVRPGESTSNYISKILTRLTLFGATFLGLVAVLPLVMQAVLGRPELAIGGTALLIVVSVVIDLVKRLDAQLAAREY